MNATSLHGPKPNSQASYVNQHSDRALGAQPGPSIKRSNGPSAIYRRFSRQKPPCSSGIFQLAPFDDWRVNPYYILLLMVNIPMKCREIPMNCHVIPSSYYYPPPILKTRVHLQFWEIWGWPIWLSLIPFKKQIKPQATICGFSP